MEKQMWFSNPKLLVLVLLPYLIIFSCIAHPNHLCRHYDFLSLLEFKRSISYSKVFANSDCEDEGQNSYSKMMSWNETVDCCSWNGVICHEITGDVIGIDLSCSQLGGMIHSNSSLFRLSQLEHLNLAYNDLETWTFPTDTSSVFSRLKYLNLSNSNVQGRFSPILSRYSQLESIDLSQLGGITFEGNDFQNLIQNLTLLRILCLRGAIFSPSKVTANFSSSLTYLDLSYTGVDGIIPHVLYLPKFSTLLLEGSNANLSSGFAELNCSTHYSLRVLDLSVTDFSGNIPNSFVYLKSLISLSLESCGFSGSFPEFIGNLTQLTTLELSDNNIHGPIPAESFSNLPKLTSLYLYGNNLTGAFPSAISNLTELQGLDITGNALTGDLPSNATGLQKLSLLYLSSNSLSGQIPAWVCSLPLLTELYLDSNQFTGIMEEFSSRSLSVIDMHDNLLYGPFPTRSISTLVGLTELYMSWNHLSGIVEQSSFSNLTQLQSLDLSYNRLSWRGEQTANNTLPNLITLAMVSCDDFTDFPYSLRNSKKLKILILSNTRLVVLEREESVNISFPYLSYLSLSSCGLRKFPHFFKNLSKLLFLFLSRNRIQGQFPSIPSMHMQVLDLGFNRLQGPLPVSICDWEKLSVLDLSNNKFSGAIPQCFENLGSHISEMNLKNNALHGGITMTFQRDGNILRSLSLNGNLLEGPLPRSLANCTELEVLDIGNNKISDMFPDWLGDLEKLQILILKSNMFFGSIANFKTNHSFSKLRVLDLSCNGFNGSIPARLFKNLTAVMSLENNNTGYMGDDEGYYNDSISVVTKGHEIVYTRIMRTLTMIDFSNNTFCGKIPNDIGNLIFLKFLNLSHNRLSGAIPSTLSNLTSLESLDLSCNELEGKIPWQMTNLNSLEVLNLSENKLVGQIPQGKQFNTFLNESYQGNKGLCGFPLTKGCAAPLPAPPQLPTDHEEEESSDFFNGFTWKAVTMGYGFGLLFGLAMGSLIFLTGKPRFVARFLENEVYHAASLLFREKRANGRLRRPNRR